MIFKNKTGFSLVELMVTLIIVSCITAALAPVITKKLKSNTITVGGSGSGELTMDCSKFGPSCGLCYTNKCVSCVKSCAVNEALDVANCNCISCPSTFGENCLKCDIEHCSLCKEGSYIKEGKCETCISGSFCDGTITSTCPKGHYCIDGALNECPPLTYNDTESATDSSACKPCTANCTDCDKTTGVCSSCSGGLEVLANGKCGTTKFTYTYTGQMDEIEKADGTLKLILKSSGTFTSKSAKSGTIFLVGAGGTGGCCHGGGGGGGYTSKRSITFSANQTFSVVIGASDRDNLEKRKTKFGTSYVAAGGKNATGNFVGGIGQGNGGSDDHYASGPCNGENGVAFDGVWYGGGGGACCGVGGKGGGAKGNNRDCGRGYDGAANTGGGGGGGKGNGPGTCGGVEVGGTGGSGVIVILI